MTTDGARPVDPVDRVAASFVAALRDLIHPKTGFSEI